MVKIIPHVDGTLRICELVKYFLDDVQLKGAWSAPAALELFHTSPATSQGCRYAKCWARRISKLT